MKILMLGWEYPPFNSGGLGIACHSLAHALVDEGATLTLVLPKKLPLSEEAFRILFADIKDVPSPYQRLHQAGAISGDFFSQVLAYATAVRAIAQSEQFEIIHAHDWLCACAGLAAKEVSAKPLVLHIHATEFDRTGGLSINQQVYQIEKEVMEKADAVVAVSQFTKDKLTRHYGIAPEKIAVVHNAIDRDAWSNSPMLPEVLRLKKAGKKIVIFVGRLTLQKGPDYFLRAANRVLELMPEVIFVIAGSGDMERQLVNEAAWLGIADNVLFAGFLRGAELSSLYRSADLFVMPSVSEPFGISALESVVNGTPVIISKQSGVLEVLPNALKVDFWDIDEITDKIIAVLRYDSLKTCLQECSAKDVAKLSWQETAHKCLELYKRVLSFGF